MRLQSYSPSALPVGGNASAIMQHMSGVDWSMQVREQAAASHILKIS